MHSSEDDEHNGDSPVISEIDTEVGSFSTLPFPIRKTKEVDDTYANLLLNIDLADISLEDSAHESKTIREAEENLTESIDKVNPISEIQSDIDFLATIHTEKNENLEVIESSSKSESNVEIKPIVQEAGQEFSYISVQSLNLENQAALREINARGEAIRLLEQQCRTLTIQLNLMQQQRQSQVIEAERLEKEKIKSENYERFIAAEIERVGY